MSINEKLGEDIYKLYTRNGFGRVLKSEIDQIVFHSFLIDSLDKKYIDSANKINYYHINKSEIFRLSQKACVTESKIKSLLENDFFHYGDKSVIDDFLLQTVNSTSIKKGVLKNGKIHFLVTNTIAKKYIEERIYSVGGIPDYSFNHEILILEIIDFLKVVRYNNNNKIAETIRKNILSISKKDENDPEITEFFKKLEEIPIEERLKKIAIGFANKFIGEAGDEIIGAVFDLIPKVEKTKS